MRKATQEKFSKFRLELTEDDHNEQNTVAMESRSTGGQFLRLIIMPPSELAHNISKFHKDYEKEYLSERISNRKTYLKKPKSAFDFILSYSFYQGRRDELSKKFEENAKRVISKVFAVNDLLSLDPFSTLLI